MGAEGEAVSGTGTRMDAAVAGDQATGISKRAEGITAVAAALEVTLGPLRSRVSSPARSRLQQQQRPIPKQQQQAVQEVQEEEGGRLEGTGGHLPPAQVHLPGRLWPPRLLQAASRPQLVGACLCQPQL